MECKANVKNHMETGRKTVISAYENANKKAAVKSYPGKLFDYRKNSFIMFHLQYINILFVFKKMKSL
jgi:hypothetical protein